MEILEKVSNIIKNKFDSKLIYTKTTKKLKKETQKGALNVYTYQ